MRSNDNSLLMRLFYSAVFIGSITKETKLKEEAKLKEETKLSRSFSHGTRSRIPPRRLSAYKKAS